VYKLAADNMGYYNGDTKSSIFYSADSADLEVVLLFETKTSAHMFTNALLQSCVSKGLPGVQYQSTYEIVNGIATPSLVFCTDYNPDEYDSATVGAKTFATSLPNVAISITLEDSLMMIEKNDLEDFDDLASYRCHLMGQSAHQELAGSASNIFLMSWAVHQRFDGLNSREKMVPQIAIRFDSVGKQEDIPNIGTRQQAVLIIECRTASAYLNTLKRVKDPFSHDNTKMEVTAFVYPPDMSEFIKCVTYKYYETKSIWTKVDVKTLWVGESDALELRTFAVQKALEAMDKAGTIRKQKKQSSEPVKPVKKARKK